MNSQLIDLESDRIVYRWKLNEDVNSLNSVVETLRKNRNTLYADVIAYLIERIKILEINLKLLKNKLIEKEIELSNQSGEYGYNLSLAEVERKHIINVLKNNNWHQLNSTKILKISRATLFRKLKEYGISVTEEQAK